MPRTSHRVKRLLHYHWPIGVPELTKDARSVEFQFSRRTFFHGMVAKVLDVEDDVQMRALYLIQGLPPISSW
jgi:hypothetical protein